MNLTGTIVKHNDFGEGTIIFVDMIYRKLKVKFVGKLIEFKYPDCIIDQSLIGADETANTKFNVIISEYSGANQNDLDDLILFEFNSLRSLHTNDYKSIIRDRIYGTDTRKIFEKFCDKGNLGWDISKATNFGQQGTPLFADYADTYRTSNVWFICKANKIVSDKRLGNFIYNDGDIIIERSKYTSNQANRITFLKTNKGYVFLGVYKFIKNYTKREYFERIFERISDIYPT